MKDTKKLGCTVVHKWTGTYAICDEETLNSEEWQFEDNSQIIFDKDQLYLIEYLSKDETPNQVQINAISAEYAILAFSIDHGCEVITSCEVIN